MGCPSTDCSPLPAVIHATDVNVTLVGLTATLKPNPDISGIGVIVGFVGTAYLTLALLIFRYLMGFPEDSSVESSRAANPIDTAHLETIWRKLPRPSEKWIPAVRSSILAMSDTQIVTGLAILASGFSQIGCGLSMFHWQIVVYLAWFSSATHLTTMTFLRRYTHDNHRFRIVRLVLMLLLVIMLGIALLPTGGNCGLSPLVVPFQLWGNFPKGRRELYGTNIYFPGFPVHCCFGLLGRDSFLKNTSDTLLSMITSELVLFFSSLTRCIKVFRTSSKFAKRWFRDKPSSRYRRFLARYHQKYLNEEPRQRGGARAELYVVGIVFLLFARAVFDLVESLIWEIMWLGLSLTWGTIRLLSTRHLASYDSASPPEVDNAVILEESFWGFGQWAPTLLLILPLISFAEACFDIADANSTATEAQSTDMGSPLVPPSASSDQALSQPAGALRTSISAESNDIAMESLYFHGVRRTGTDLANMEDHLGTPSLTHRNSGVTIHGRPQENFVPEPTIPGPLLHEYNFYVESWYNDFVAGILFLFLEFAIEIIYFSLTFNQTTILSMLQNFATWQLWLTIVCLYFYVSFCINIQVHPSKLNSWLECLPSAKRMLAYRTLRWAWMISLCLINGPDSVFSIAIPIITTFVVICGLGLASKIPGFKKD